MRVLILSCNTGQGHNAAGQAIMENLQLQGEYVEMLDYMKLASERTSKIVDQTYVNVAKYTPHLFGVVYRLGMLISNRYMRSPVYYANKLMARLLLKYINENSFDVIVMPHLFPAETITYMKEKYHIRQKTVAVATDYTCIPFWEETNCDAYVIPHEDLMEEYIKRGVPKEKIYPLGIPVKEAFHTKLDCSKIRKKLNLDNRPVLLLMSGSMGFGKIQLFTYELSRSCKNGEQIIVICGNNKHLYRILSKEFASNKRVHIIGYTKYVPELMQLADVVYTKPGGLTSTEAIVKNRPLVHTSPIPGCETKNASFFVTHGMSNSAFTIKEQIYEGIEIIRNDEKCKKELLCQQRNAKPDAAKNIYHLMKSLCEEN